MEKINNSDSMLNVLCLEDALNDVRLIEEILIKEGYRVSMDVVDREKEFVSCLNDKKYDLILADYTLPGFDIYTALNMALELQPEVPFICVSGTIGEDTAVELLKLGATDYILKDRLGRLAFSVRRALDGVVKQNEWKKTIEALRDSEERYRVLFEGSTLGILATDVETFQFLYSNPAVYQLFGYTDQEFLHLCIADIHPKDALNLVMSEFDAQSRGEKKISPALPCVKKDGTIFYADISGTSSSFYGRKCNVGFFTDVTDRKQAEDAMRESKAMYQVIFESTGTATFISEEDTTIQMANKECFSIMGYTPEELIGQKWIQLFAAESLQEMLNNHELRRRNPELAPKKYEVKLRNKWGELRDVIIEVGMIPFTKQSIVSILDITELKQAEEALIKLKKAIYTSGEAIFLTDKDGIFTFVNPAFTTLYGFYAEELIGKETPRILNSGVCGKSFYEVFWATLLKGDEVKWEIVNKRKDGSVINIEASATPVIDEKNNIIGFLGIQHDITHRKLAEQELIMAKEKAEESDRLKTAFLNNISHEIRTPFNGILGFLSIIQDDELTVDERDEYIGLINESADRLMQTVNDIVEMSQIQTGQIKPVISETSIKKLVDKLSERYGPIAGKKGLKFNVIDDSPVDLSGFYTDGIKLKTILSNLIINAIKFTEEGAIDLHICKKNFYYEFSVKDTGIGISQSQQQTIFELFKQADVSNTRQFEGLGLGLSITQSYVEMLGGMIWLESEPGKGSTFYIKIPEGV